MAEAKNHLENTPEKPGITIETALCVCLSACLSFCLIVWLAICLIRGVSNGKESDKRIRKWGRITEAEKREGNIIFTVPFSLSLSVRELGIVLYAIGIGEEINEEELLSIAGDKERVFLVENFEQLQELRSKIMPFDVVPVAPRKPSKGIKCVQVK